MKLQRTSVSYLDDKKDWIPVSGHWDDIKKHECHSASFFVIPAGDAGIQTVHWV